MAVGGRRWPSVAVGGRRWPSVAVGGRRWPSVAVGGRRGPSVSFIVWCEVGFTGPSTNRKSNPFNHLVSAGSPSRHLSQSSGVTEDLFTPRPASADSLFP